MKVDSKKRDAIAQGRARNGPIFSFISIANLALELCKVVKDL
jgi:hypothetical protein